MNTAQNTNLTIGLDPFCYNQFDKKCVNFIPYSKEEFFEKMPTIYLKQKSCSYKFGTSNVKVSGEIYGTCKLFKKYKHQIEFRKTGNIYVSNGIAGWSFGDSNFLNLKADNLYKSAELQSVDVYFNQYEDTNPLLFVLHFQNSGDSTAQDRYYKMSSFDTDKKGGKEISQLPTFDGDSSILDALISANDTIADLLTFDIGKTITRSSTSGGGSYSRYNDNKIRVTDDSGSDPQLSNGFKKYKHTPLETRNVKNGCVIYNNDVLMGRDGTTPIGQIQNQQYSEVNVYFGEKEKRSPKNGSTSGSKDVPLLIELIKSGGPDYYVHKKKHTNGGTNGVKYYWENLSGDGQELKSLLEDIGLSTNVDGRGHSTLRSLLNGASLGNGDGELSGQLQKATGDKLKSLLEQKVNESKPLLLVMLARVEFNMVDSVVILVGRKEIGDGSYKESEISHEVENLEPPREINRIKLSEGVEIVLKEASQNFNCLQKYFYKVMEHNFSKYVEKLNPSGQESAGLRFLIPAASNGGKYKELSLYDSTGPENLVYKYYRKGGSNPVDKVYVVFYGSDKRPLMICYNGNAYKPKKQGEPTADKQVFVNYTEWIKVTGITNCGCNGDGSQNNQLLETLNEVIGFLNPVQLNPKQIPKEACETITATPPPKNTTYELHDYTPKIKMKITRDTVGCYGKYTYEPAGTSKDGNNGTGFRLGNVLYTDETRSSKLHNLEYYSKSTYNKYKPLLTVHVYYYDQDTDYKDPLLVVLEFKNNGGTEGNLCEYYKLTKTLSESGGNMTWEKDQDACKLVEKKEKCDELVKHLDSIRYKLKKVLQIKLECKSGTYQLRGRDAKPGGLNEFGPIKGAGGNQVKVEDCTEKCPQLTSAGYRCFQHQISTIDGDFDYNQVGGVAFTIPGANGSVIEIKLFSGTTEPPDCANGQPGQIGKLAYNKCMEDVYVFFYAKSRGGVDTVPLMLWYNKCYYRPCNRDEYLEMWVQVSGLRYKGKPCEGGDGGTELVKQLNEVNKALNRIDLDKSSKASQGTGGGYGLPDEGGGITVDKLKFPSMRVSLKRQDGPSQPSGNHAYVKVVHRTVNGFTIGDIKYNGQEIVQNGVKINGGVTIEVKKNGGKPAKTHKQLVTQKGCNTVVAYYSTTDTGFMLPQLIVILKTDKEVVTSTPVTGSASTGYGYYILSNKNGGSKGAKYEYVWHPVTNYPPKQTPVTLDDKTDFSLLNSIVILLEMKNNGNKYGDSEIKPAISNAIKNQPYISSPGRSNDINRITGKTITVKNEADGKGKCLNKTGFKVITHDISALVNPNGKLGGVTLIAGLRFLMPSPFRVGYYKQLPLYEEMSCAGSNKFVSVIKYHQNGQNKICVYFYDQDPRPLLLCYNSVAYAAKGMLYYFMRWVKVTKISNCECKGTQGCCDELVKALVDVSDFLNPVKIYETGQTYGIHWFNGNEIKINIESKKATEKFCYHRYTHTHCGTSDCKSNGKGFRLGTIYYGCNCIQLKDNGSKNVNCITSALNGEPPGKHKSADQVVVFYYKHDNDHKYPMVVAMGTTNGGRKTVCNLYYVLKDKGKKLYEKKEENLDLDDNEKLGPELDNALFSNNNHLQIIIDKRPVVQLYTPDDKDTPDCNESADVKGLEQVLKDIREMDYKIMNCEIKGNPGEPKTCVFKDKTGNFCVIKRKPEKPGEPGNYHCEIKEKPGNSETEEKQITYYYLPTKTSYQSKFYENEGQLAKSEPKETNIQVTPIDCWQLTTYGYKCYEHKITTLQKVEEIGGLRFFLWDNTGGSSSGNPSNGKELCLYKESSADSTGEGSSSCTATVASSEPGKSACGAPAKSSQLKPVTTTYTTCKGNVYVYFYGDDPRPLILS